MEEWPKIWGKNTEIFRNQSTSVNFLNLVKGGTCSYHYHKFKSNIFYVIEGKLKVRTEVSEHVLFPGQSLVVKPLLKHQFEAMEKSRVVEVMFVEYSPDDIVRETEGFIQDYGKEKR